MRYAAIATTAWFMALTVHSFAQAQTPPSAIEVAQYEGLHRAAYEGALSEIERLLGLGVAPDGRDARGRTPLHVAAFASHIDVVAALAGGGADLNALESDRYDIVTIAAVANDLPMLELALSVGASAQNITSRYDGTALIAAAHLGHHEVVERLIQSGAPLDHVNNLGWTALIEAIVLGDGGPAHVACAQALLKAGADRTIADRQGVLPLAHAKGRGFTAMVAAFD